MSTTSGSAPRTLLYNGDCNFLFYNPELWQPKGGRYRASAIHRCIETIARGGVDTLLVNPNTQVAWYPSQTLENVFTGYTRSDRTFLRRIAAANAALTPAQVEDYLDVMTDLFDRYLDLAEEGTDWLAECASSSRKQGMSPWLSYRMNATHFSGKLESPVNARIFRDKKNRLSGRAPGGGSVDHAWLGLNYAQSAVRDHMFTMIREGVEAYDYEGLELDWLRHPLCVESPARPRDLDALTEWIGDLRSLTSAKKRSYPLGLRVPGNLGYLRSIGLDLPRLVKRGLLDFVVFSNYWQTPWTMPFDELRSVLGSEVKLYAGIEGAPNWLPALAPSLRVMPKHQELQLAGDSAKFADAPRAHNKVRGTRYLPASAAFLRGAAASKWVLPVDGIETFNFFVTDQVRVPGQRADYAALRDVRSLATLRGKEKHYALNTASGNSHEWWDASMVLPAQIPSGQSRTFRLPLCSEPSGKNLRLVVQVITKAEKPGTAPKVSINGQWENRPGKSARQLLFPSGPYRVHVPEHLAWNTTFPVERLQDGWNEITLHNSAASDLTLVGLELGIIRQRRTSRVSD